MAYFGDFIDVMKFAVKLGMVIVTAILGSPPLQKVVTNMLEKWSKKKVEHIELAAKTFDERVARLEEVYEKHDKRLDVSDGVNKNLITSNKTLTDKLASCETAIAKTVTEVGSVNTDFKKNIELMSVTILERLEKDEGTLSVHDSAIRSLLGKVTIK